MDFRLFSTTFALIFVSELPDKTAFASLLLATRHHPFAVFLGAAGAFVIQSAVAVACGSIVGLLPERVIHTGSGLLFLVLAFFMWRRHAESEESARSEEDGNFRRAVATSFVTIFIAEWGDLTQIATATFAAKYHAPGTIFAAATLALWAVTGLGVILGRLARHAVQPAVLQRVAAAAMAAVGIYLLVAG